MSYSWVFQGPPSGVASPGTLQAPADGIDSVNNIAYLNTGAGWKPEAPATVAGIGSNTGAGSGNLTAQAANQANVLTYAVPAHMSGVYRVTIYESSTNTPTGATLPAVTAVFTEQDTGSSTTATLASVGSVSSAGVLNNGTLICNAKGGNNIVIATTSYAAGSGTALQYNIHVRIDFMS